MLVFAALLFCCDEAEGLGQLPGVVVSWGEQVINYVQPGTKLTAIAAGDMNSLALTSHGTVLAWGDNSLGQTNVPSGLTNAVAIAAGWDHSLALIEDGRVVAWGWNAYGQTNVPPGLSNVVAIAGGREHSLALTTEGRIVAWGGDSYGQSDVPPTLGNVVGIVAGGYHTLALMDEGVAPRLVNPAFTGGNFTVSVWTFLRKNYSFEFNKSMTQTNWRALSLIPGTGAMKTLTDTNVNRAKGFYRIRVQ